MSINTLSKLIEKHQKKIVDEIRQYIGASSIGSDCLRQIWYGFKGYPSQGVVGKTRRTWDIGKALEALVIRWLTDAGVKVEQCTTTFHAKSVPIFQGHYDGLVIFGKKRSILEIKTAKDASFKIFVSKGVKVWNPQYYAQIQSYMGMSGIFSAYILVLNKDNSDISDEFVEFDEDFYRLLENKAQMISTAAVPPPKVDGSPLWYQCKMCRYNKECHG